MFRIKKPITFGAAFVAASFLLFVNASPLVQEGMPESPKGEQHEWLAQDVGIWNAKGVMKGPMGDMEFDGTETVTSDLGGLWIFSTFDSEMMGMPFKGRSVIGYNPMSKQFEGAWVDSMTPRMALTNGTRDGDTLTMMGEGVDPETGKTFPEKQVSRREGEDKRVLEMYDVSDGGEKLIMTLTYTRKK